jgi:peptidoglycan/LPS O-acetylase OafA/YrhL
MTTAESQATRSGAQASSRVHYLDWLRVIAILIVFLYHSVHPFDLTDWHIKNVEQSLPITIILVILSMWGMPFFFTVAGAAGWFALQRRTVAHYIRERFMRLLVPFFVGCVLFIPLVRYLEWMNKTQRGVESGSFSDFWNGMIAWFVNRGVDPVWFGFGEHLWFLGFLFSFALLTLPLFLWLRSEAGKRFVSRLAVFCERRGVLFVLLLPILAVELSLRPLTTQEHSWADFVVQMCFFALGFLLFADERFLRVVRRDGWLLLGVGTAVVLILFGLYAAGYPILEWGENPAAPQFYVIKTLVMIVAFSCTLGMLFIGMRFLDFANAQLRYAQEAALPFFVIHQPVIIIIAFFVVQWRVGLPVKMVVVMVGSFAACIALYELVIRRVGFLRAFFGMTSRHVEPSQAGAG